MTQFWHHLPLIVELLAHQSHFQSTFNVHQSECMNNTTKLILKHNNSRHHPSYTRHPCKILAKIPCFFDPLPKFKWKISGAPKKLNWRNQIAQPTKSDPVLTHAGPSAHSRSSWLRSRNSTRSTLTTATTQVTVQRVSGTARMPFLAAKDEPPPTCTAGTALARASGTHCQTGPDQSGHELSSVCQRHGQPRHARHRRRCTGDKSLHSCHGHSLYARPGNARDNWTSEQERHKDSQGRGPPQCAYAHQRFCARVAHRASARVGEMHQ